MQIKWIVVAGFVVSLWAAGPVLANDKKGNAGGNAEKSKVADSPAQAGGKAEAVEGGSAHKEPWVGINVSIGPPEKEVIREYVHPHSEGAKTKKGKGLPPGLAKKVA